MLLFNQQVDLLLMDLLSNKSTIAISATYSTEFDYSYSHKKFFWINSEDNSLLSSSINGAEQKTSIVSNLKGAEDLAVDWILDIIYWTDSHTVTISACSTDGTSGIIEILSKNIEKPQSIAV